TPVPDAGGGRGLQPDGRTLRLLRSINRSIRNRGSGRYLAFRPVAYGDSSYRPVRLREWLRDFLGLLGYRRFPTATAILPGSASGLSRNGDHALVTERRRGSCPGY